MPKKRKKKPQNGKQSKALVTTETLEQKLVGAYSNLKDDRPEKLVSSLILGCSFQEAAERAGYSKAYARGNLYTAFKNSLRFRRVIENITSKVGERYRQICQLRLGMVAEIEQAALKQYLEDPKLAIEKPQLLKHVKTAARVLGGELPEQSFNYTQVQVLMGSNYAQLPGRQREDFVDCEFEEMGD
jgi:DNA-directed RNA polymerase specialized sigma24 family protein